jgi:hypothetical protein
MLGAGIGLGDGMSWERDRDKGFENEFAHREEVAFKAAAHRNRLLGVWAAQKMQLRHKDAESYVDTLVTGDVAHLRGRSIVQKLLSDFKAAGVAVSEHEVNAEFDRLDAESRKEMKSS